MAKNKLSFYETKSKPLLLYNAMDCSGTARIFEELRSEARWEETRTQRLYRYHVALSKLCAEMHTSGMWVHEMNHKFMVWFLEQKYLQQEKKFLRLVGLPKMRCMADDLRKLIFRRHETATIKRFSLPDPFDPKMYTDETLETISVDATALKILIAEGDIDEELKRIITTYWEAETTWKSRAYLVSKRTMQAIGPDGYLRPSWNSCGTDTMRFSCRDPNIMQWDKLLLQMVGVPPGEILVGMDKSQLEIRVVEIVSQDDFLWKLIQTGDVYSADVRDAMGLGPDVNVKKGPPELQKARQDFKVNRLACQYMAGLATVYAQWLESDPEVDFQKVKMHYDRFHRVHAAGIVRYAHDELHWCAKHGYSEGRVLHGRRYYPAPPPITEACNWPIQRTASEMMNVETIAFWRRLKKEVPSARLIFQKHDAVAVRCPERYGQRVKKLMSDCYTTEYTINGRTRPFPIEIKLGQTLGDV